MQLFIILILGLSLILSLIGITTNYWYKSLSNEFNEGLWFYCQSSSLKLYICRRTSYFKSQGLAISGLILLFISFIISLIRRYKKDNRSLIYLTILILIGSTLLLTFSYLLYPREIYSKQPDYSIYFMLISSILLLITIGLVIYNTRTIQST